MQLMPPAILDSRRENIQTGRLLPVEIIEDGPGFQFSLGLLPSLGAYRLEEGMARRDPFERGVR